ncbi:SOUL family heme-binding protein [Micromonospora sp. WMMD736]|uniref:SOUL family heme-binding protein n=1 Tax=Micromonospora sp. WMMD736 TaxID=3404112 RepID=UPI003B962A18
MITRAAELVRQVGESTLAIAGVRVGTEEPVHSITPLAGDVEIRRYGTRIAAETMVAAGEEEARNAGFRLLAGYIFGGNHRKTKIAMTAPVSQLPTQSQAIAMTVPVVQTSSPDQGWVIRFFMPSKWTMDTLPTPNDERVQLVEVPPETVAVLRFTGDRGPATVAARTDELLQVLREYGFETTGTPAAWFYDPPWTLPFRRRNEIAVPVSAD